MPATLNGHLMDGINHSYIPTEPLDIDPGLRIWDGDLPEVDPITYEVLRHNLWHINEEHGATIVKVSGSPIAVFGQDFNPCLMDERGDFIFFGPYLQFHAGMQDCTVKWILENRGANPGIREGDIFLSNDPWVGTSHQQDTATMCPVFWEAELFCWVGSTLHFPDLGGPTPGGWCPAAESVYEEPVPMPPVKIVESGILRRDLEDMWVRRSRLRDLVALDLRAVIAGCNVARERVLRLIRRYGPHTVKAVMRKIVDDSERAWIEKMRRIPDGVWREQAFIEVALPGDRRTYRGVLTMRKQGEELTFSNAGTDPQVGSLNITYAGWRGGILSVISPLLCYDSLFAIGGALRHCSFVPESGTITCADFPGSVSNGGALGVLFSLSLASKAIASMMSTDEELTRELACMTGISQWPVMSLYGQDQRGEDYSNIILDWYAASMGAQASRDGVHTGGVYWAPMHTSPNVEHNEHVMPILYVYRRELPDSGGVGRYVGGAGPAIAFVPYETDRILHQISACGMAVPTALGLAGGHPGLTTSLSLLRGSDVRERHRQGHLPGDLAGISGERHMLTPKEKDIVQGLDDVYEAWCPTGGGYGDPLERDPGAVAEDVALGYWSSDAARRFFGVALDDEGKLDAERTKHRRATMRRERIGHDVDFAAVHAPKRDPVLLLSDYLRVDADDGDTHIRCRRCGHDLGSTAENFRLHCAQCDAPLTEAGPRFRDPSLFVDDAMVFRRFFCPGCATQLDTEVARADEPPFQTVELAPSWLAARASSLERQALA